METSKESTDADITVTSHPHNSPHTDVTVTSSLNTHNSPQVGKNEMSSKLSNRNKDFCFFCEDFVLNFARHIKRNHSTECEVQEILSKPQKSKIRRDLLALLKKKGNYIVNCNNCVRPVKNSKYTTMFLPCTYCLGFYSSKQLWRHRKICSANSNSNTYLKNQQADAQNFLVKHLSIDEKLRSTVFPRMRADDISLIAKRDTLICAFGARYLKIHREKHYINVISRKMRELAKILKAIKALDPSLKNLFQALTPKNYDLFVKATKIVAKFDELSELFISPTFAMNIGTSLKQCCEIAILYALKKKQIYKDVQSDHSESDFKTMIQLFESHWKFDISSHAADDLNMQKWNKISIVPLASDLKLLKDFLQMKATSAMNNLIANNKNEEAYNELLETVYCRVLLLNRKRPGELQRLLLHYYNNTENEKYEEFDEVVSITEKVLLKSFKRLVIRGKRGRGVPVLFSLDVQEHISILLKFRSNFVDHSNPFLFAKANTSTPIYGYKTLQKYVQACGAKNPKGITSTRLRKHLATLTQMFNMSEGDIEQLSTFMGHTTGIHKKSYRLPDDVYQTAKIAKILILMENGKAANFKGKSLDEIEVNMDENLFETTENVNNQSEDEDDDEEQVDDIETTYQNDLNKVKFVESMEKEKQNVQVNKKIAKKRTLIPWSNEQKKIVTMHFKTNIKEKRPPKRVECEELKQKYPILDNKSWEKIKVFIQNIYKKY